MTEGIETTYVKMEAEAEAGQAVEEAAAMPHQAQVIPAEANADEGAQSSSVATDDMLQAARLLEAALYQDWEDWELAAAMGRRPQQGARCRVVGQMFAGDRAMVPRQSMDFQLRPGEELRLTFRMEEPVWNLATSVAAAAAGVSTEEGSESHREQTGMPTTGSSDKGRTGRRGSSPDPGSTGTNRVWREGQLRLE